MGEYSIFSLPSCFICLSLCPYLVCEFPGSQLGHELQILQSRSILESFLDIQFMNSHSSCYQIPKLPVDGVKFLLLVCLVLVTLLPTVLKGSSVPDSGCLSMHIAMCSILFIVISSSVGRVFSETALVAFVFFLFY